MAEIMLSYHCPPGKHRGEAAELSPWLSAGEQGQERGTRQGAGPAFLAEF